MLVVLKVLALLMTTNAFEPKTKHERCTGPKLGRAAGSQSLETLQTALEGWTAPEVDDLANSGKNPVHMAAWRGCMENLKFLIETLGCDVNRISTGKFSYGKTPIFFAATRNRNDVVEYLLGREAHVKIINNKGQSLLSIASSHLSDRVVERIRIEESRQVTAPWWNFRESHSDGFEYGDLDPRFLDRNLRDSDNVTELCVNPTTKQSRRGGFLRRNSHLAREDEKRNSSAKANPKKPNPVELSPAERDELEFAWESLLTTWRAHAGQSTNDMADSLYEVFRTIVSLSDKQHGPWIPEAAKRLKEASVQEHLTKMVNVVYSVAELVPEREAMLLQKLASEIAGVRERGTKVSGKKMHRRFRARSSVHATRSLFDQKKSSLRKVLKEHECFKKFQRPNADILHLVKRPVWVDSLETLISLESQLEQTFLSAIDTEWGDRTDGTPFVATLQVALPCSDDVWVVDLLAPCPAFQKKAKCLLQGLFRSPRIVLGFAIGNDLPLLEEWLGAPLLRQTCIDVQMLYFKKGQPPGLATLLSHFSKIPLSKEEQCSDWARRPLSDAQLEYAGLDAAILLPLLAKKLPLQD